MIEKCGHLFFDNKHEFKEWLVKQNRANATWGGISKSYDGYDWFIVDDLSCYVPIEFEEYKGRVPIGFKIFSGFILFCIIAGIAFELIV